MTAAAPTVVSTATVRNPRGLHARAAARFVRRAGAFEAKVTVHKDGLSADGQSILGLMALSASEGTSIRIEATGPDAQAAADALCRLVENQFDEDR